MSKSLSQNRQFKMSDNFQREYNKFRKKQEKIRRRRHVYEESDCASFFAEYEYARSLCNRELLRLSKFPDSAQKEERIDKLLDDCVATEKKLYWELDIRSCF